MSTEADPEAWARLRFAVVGPMLASPPEGRQLQLTLRELAAREWTHPTRGTPIRFGVSTIERWYYLAKNATDPLRALRRRSRGDRGRSRVLGSAITAIIGAQYRQHPSWSVQLHHDNLAVLVGADPTLGPMPSYSTLRRHLAAHGLERRRAPKAKRPGAEAAAARHARLETRSYESSHVNALWHLDFHHGSRQVLEPDGRWIRPLLLGILDDHSRLVCHLQWYRHENVESLVHGFIQALARRGLPRAVMSDNGSAMVAAEFVSGLERLGIVHERTLPYTPCQNGKQESFWGSVEGRLIAMLESAAPMGLDELNRLTQIWLEGDYHRRVHTEIDGAPLTRFLEAPSVGRDAPDARTLRQSFRQRERRRQRRSDGTLSLGGRRFEIPGRFHHLAHVHVAWARWNLASVDLVDPETGAILAALHPLDREANANGQRRTRPLVAPDDDGAGGENGADTPEGEGTLAPLMVELIEEFVATGLPPAFVPSPGAPPGGEQQKPEKGGER